MKLLDGYLISNFDLLSRGEEQLFAVYPDGKVMTCIRKYYDSFFETTDKWETIEKLPEEAQFIGKYEY